MADALSLQPQYIYLYIVGSETVIGILLTLFQWWGRNWAEVEPLFRCEKISCQNFLIYFSVNEYPASPLFKASAESLAVPHSGLRRSRFFCTEGIGAWVCNYIALKSFAACNFSGSWRASGRSQCSVAYSLLSTRAHYLFSFSKVCLLSIKITSSTDWLQNWLLHL